MLRFCHSTTRRLSSTSPLSFTLPTQLSMASFSAQSSSAQAVSNGDVKSVFELIQKHQDLLANLKCSLLLARDPQDRTDSMVTLHADAISVTEKDEASILAAWLSILMHSGNTKLQKLIQQLSSKPVASHMNKDHAEDTRSIVQHSTTIPMDSAYMLEMDSLGFNVKADYQGKTFKLRIPVPRCAEDRK